MQIQSRFSLVLISSFLLISASARATGARADLACAVFQQPFDGVKAGTPIKIAEQKTVAFELGKFPAPDMEIALPVPFQDVSLQVTNMLTAFPESPMMEPISEIQTAFYKLVTGGPKPQLQSFAELHINIDVSEVKAGSSIILRESYLYSPQVFLTYRCAVKFL